MLLGQRLLLVVKELAADAVAAILLGRISSGFASVIWGGRWRSRNMVTDSVVLLAIAALA